MTTGRLARTFNRLLLVAAALACGLGGGVVWLQSEGGQTWLAAAVVRRANGLLEGGGVEAQRIRVAHGGVRVVGVRLVGEGGDVLVVPAVRAEVRWRSLLAGRIQIDELALEAPALTLRRRPSGWDLPSTPPSTAPAQASVSWMPAGWSLVVERLHWSGGRVELPDDQVTAVRWDLSSRIVADADTVEVRGVTSRWTQQQPEIGEFVVHADLALHTSDLEQVEITLDGPGLSGRLSGSVAGIAAPPGALDLELAASATWHTLGRLDPRLHEAISGLDVEEVTLRGRLGGTVTSPTVDLDASWLPDAPPFFVGHLALETVSPPKGTIDVRAPDMALLERVGSPLRTGEIRLHGPVAGPDVSQLRATLEATGSELSAVGAHVDRLRGTVDLSTPLRVGLSVQTDTLDLSVGDAGLPLAGSLRLDLQGNQVDLAMGWRDRRSPKRQVELEGTADLDARRFVLADLWLQPEPSVIWRQTRPTVIGWTPGGLANVRAHLDSDHGVLRVEAPHLGERPFDVTVHLEQLQLDHVAEVAAHFGASSLPPMRGRLSGDLRPTRATEGPAWTLDAQAQDLFVDGQLHGVQLEAHGQLDAERAMLAARVERDGRALGELSAAVPVTGAADMAPSLRCGDLGTQVQVYLPEVSIATLRQAFPGLPATPDQLDGLQADLDATGDPCDPDLLLDTVLLGSLEGTSARVEARVVDGPDHIAKTAVTLSIDGHAVGSGKAAVAHIAPHDAWTSQLPLAEMLGAFSASLQADDVPSEVLMPTAPGSMVGNAHFRGHATTVEAVSGRMSWHPQMDGIALPLTAVVRTDEDGMLRAQVDLENARANPELRIATELAALQEAGADAPLSGTLDDLTLPIVDMAALGGGAIAHGTGLLHASGTLGGTVGQPRADLDVHVVDGGFTLPSTGVRYEDVQVSARVEDQRLTLLDGHMRSRPRRRTLRGKGPQQSMQLSGTIALGDEGVLEPDLRARMDKAWLMATGDAEIRASGDVTLRRQGSELVLGGRVQVDEGEYTVDRSAFADAAPTTLHPDITFVAERDTQSPMEAEDEPSSFVDQIALDLAVDLGERLRLSATIPLTGQSDVLGRAADVEVEGTLAGTLEVKRTMEQLDLRGRLESEGTVRLLTTRFGVERGVVAFAGGDLTEPNLDFDLSRETASYGSVTARISGTPSALTVSELASSEFSDEADIVSLLLLGRPVSQLDPTSSGASGNSAAVQSALLAVAGSQLGDVLGSQVQVTAEGVAVDLSLGGKTFLTILADPLAEEDENTVEANLTWLLGRRAELRLQTGDSGTASTWISWRRRF